MAPDSNRVYSGTYSNVPVYELHANGTQIMRRRNDDWINATHILKVADFDKPARTRILEREVQKGVHEKVQGGYGKYQGTWIPLHDGRALAERNGVLEVLRPIFDYVPGERSPPPAPKHSTAASAKPRASRQTAAPKRSAGQQQTPRHNKSVGLTGRAALSHIAEEYEGQMHESETPDNVTIASEAYGDDYMDTSQYPNSLKRKRVEDVMSLADQQHQLWADELLDYFMLRESPQDPLQRPPVTPPSIDLDRPIDDKGHTALHWASAMGDLAVTKDLIQRGANIDVLSKNGETALIRSVLFTNNFDMQTMERLVGWLVGTVQFTDWHGSTVFHHIALSTMSKSKYACARYYLDCLLNKMTELYSPVEIENILNVQDRMGDTAITIAAKNGARKLVRSLIGRNAAVDIPNDQGETADELIVQLNHRRRDGRHRQLSSSPFQMDPSILSAVNGNGRASLPGTFQPTSSIGYEHASEAATALTTQIFPLLLSKSEKLASTFNAEIAEKEAEIADAERVIRSRKDEIEALKRQARDLAARDRDDQYDEDVGQDLQKLVEDAEALLEEEQDRDLQRLVHEARNGGLQDGDMDIDTTMNGDGDSGYGTDDLARRLAALQDERRRLVKDVVQNQSMAGVGQKQSEYKRLITSALNVREDDVEGMLPDIVAELEDSRVMDGAA